MLVLLAIAVLLSTNRRTLNPRTVVGALLIQRASAFVVLYWDFGRRMLRGLTNVSGGTVRRKLRSVRD
ncbi:MAG TPA: Na+ dependent nucleoside transporter N-terminal domain-containing protein [Rubrobacter sp.]|jgi:CNT family concentrative nucleoside transporter|nr:Na+ dependent nucleoside transporter N-terminal domain-containing protein [Rubrobacter sp.]